MSLTEMCNEILKGEEVKGHWSAVVLRKEREREETKLSLAGAKCNKKCTKLS